MKRFIVPALLLNAILLGVRAWQEHPAHAGTVATANGDTNGDGERDISDALYMLFWLFNGGPQPVALADTEAVSRQEFDSLQARVEGFGQLLGHFSIVQTPIDDTGGTATTIRLSGVNLQVVNGLDATNGNPSIPIDANPDETHTNGTGNVIVGYQEMLQAGNIRGGSHNVIVGSHNNYQSFGGIVVGRENSISGEYASSISGFRNRASGYFAATIGGVLNVATGQSSVVAAGEQSAAHGTRAIICGGLRNSIPGNDDLNVFGQHAAILGGVENSAKGNWSVVSGGKGRSVDGDFDWRAGELFQEE